MLRVLIYGYWLILILPRFGCRFYSNVLRNSAHSVLCTVEHMRNQLHYIDPHRYLQS